MLTGPNASFELCIQCCNVQFTQINALLFFIPPLLFFVFLSICLGNAFLPLFRPLLIIFQRTSMKLQVMGTTTAASGIFVANLSVLVLADADADAVKDMDMT